MKYQQKPLVVDAWQWNGEDAKVFCEENGLPEFNTGNTATLSLDGDYSWSEFGLVIPTLEGNHVATKGDYIIRGLYGEYYPCKPDVFEATYSTLE